MIKWNVCGTYRYAEESKKDDVVKLIHGPIYVRDNIKHSYQEPVKPDHLNAKYLRGPIYINDDTRHHFSQIEEHLETLKELTGPIYNVEGKSQYHAILDRIQSIKSVKSIKNIYKQVLHFL